MQWLGEVPGHWRVTSLKRIVAVPITDGPHETPAFVDNGVPFVSAEAVSSGRIDFSKVRACISMEDNIRYSVKYSPKLHDIYMVKSGATTGVTAMVEGRTDFNIWSPLAAIRCGRDAIPRFRPPLHALTQLSGCCFAQLEFRHSAKHRHECHRKSSLHTATA